MSDRLAGIQCVVLDFDGTLVDSNAIKRGTYDDVFSPLGADLALVETTLARVRGDRHDVAAVLIRALADAGRLPAGTDEGALAAQAVAEYTRRCEEAVSRCQERPGTSEALPQLAARYVLYLNSDTPEETLRRIVERRGWTQHFRAIYGRPGTKVQSLEQIAAREGLTPQEMALVGDGRRDWEAARTFGCRFLGVQSDGNDFGNEAVPLLQDLRELVHMPSGVDGHA